MGETESSKGQILLTAQAGSSVRLEALAKGAAKRARVAMEYFILFFCFFPFLLLARKFSINVVVFLSIKSNVLQWNTVFNESVGKRSKLVEVEVEKVRRSRRGDGCNTFLLTEIGMNACSEQRPRLDPSRTQTSLSFLSRLSRERKVEQPLWLLRVCSMGDGAQRHPRP